MVRMELVGVRLEVPAQAPVMMLRETEAPRRLLPIYIGSPEAAAIHYAVEGIEPTRPLTHDLLAQVIDTLGAVVERVVITEIREHTYYAELVLVPGDDVDSTITVSARPSDAVALAVRIGCEIFASHAVLDIAGRVEDEVVVDDEVEDSDILAEFQDFIASVSPDDFAE